MIERQELCCKVCKRYVQFDLDLSIDGNHVVVCPRCSNQHYRAVHEGQLVGDHFWNKHWGQTFYVPPSGVTQTRESTFDSTTAGSPALYRAWMDTNVHQ